MSGVFPTGNALGGGGVETFDGIGLGYTLLSLMGCLFISDKIIFIDIYYNHGQHCAY